MYTDYTLAFEFVTCETKYRQIDTITQWNWDLSCQKKGLSKNRGENVHGLYTCLRVRWRLEQVPSI